MGWGLFRVIIGALVCCINIILLWIFNLISNYMGNNIQVDQSLFPYSYQEWKDTGDHELYIEPKSGTNSVLRTKDQLSQQQYASYRLRALNSDFLVSIVAISCSNSQSNNADRSQPKINYLVGCSSIKHYKIMRENIVYRLADLGPCSYDDSLYILSQVLNAVEVLFSAYGQFGIDEDMIGFTTDGRCKFWFNSDYDSIAKQIPKATSASQSGQVDPGDIFSGEKAMVMQILDIVEDRMMAMMDQDQKSQYTRAKELYGLMPAVSQSNSKDKISKKHTTIKQSIRFIRNLCKRRSINPSTYRVESAVVMGLLGDAKSFHKTANDRISLRKRIKHYPTTKLTNIPSSASTQISLTRITSQQPSKRMSTCWNPSLEKIRINSRHELKKIDSCVVRKISNTTVSVFQ